jgi:hypothetical protein
MAIASVNAASSTGRQLAEGSTSLDRGVRVAGRLAGHVAGRPIRPQQPQDIFGKKRERDEQPGADCADGQSSAGALALQMAESAAQKRQSELIALVQKLNPVQTNYTPPAPVDALDTNTNILTMANGTQIDTTTGLQYHEPGSIVSMANGAYLDTKNNILTMSDGTKIDTVTGLTITSLICVTSSEHGRRFDRRRLCRSASRSIAAGGRRQDAAHEHAGVGRYRQASGSRAAEFQSSR